MELNFATISALIGIIGGILGIFNQLHNLRRQQDDEMKAQAVRDAKMDERLKTIEDKLDEHNGYAKLFSEVKESIVAIQTDINWLKEKK